VIQILLALACALQAAPPSGAPPVPPAGTPSAPGAPSAPAAKPPMAPPFVPATGVQPQAVPQALGQAPPPYIKGGRQWVVEPGTSWRLFADQVQPGDEILFTAWFHEPQEFEGLQGTAERPIFIRSRDDKPAAIACEATGLNFRRCKHIVVENIMFFNPGEAAIRIDGRPVEGAPADSPLAAPAPGGWSSEIVVRHCNVAGSRGENQDGVQVIASSGVIVDAIRVDGWNDAAVEVTDSRRVLVRGLMAVPTETTREARGIAVLGASGDISVTSCSLNAGIGVGVQVGTAGKPNENGVPPVPPVERMRVDRCLFDRVGTPILLANVRDLVISRATIVDPRDAVYALPEDAGVVTKVTFEYCLASWLPGGVRAFSPHPNHVRADGITLGDNLWFSAELPAAWEVLGAPFGYQASEQVTGKDPSLDPTTLRPRSADAVRYGVYSIAVPTSAGSSVTVPDPQLPTAPPAARPPVRQPPSPPARTPASPPAGSPNG
jgi:hypothetical protein